MKNNHLYFLLTANFLFFIYLIYHLIQNEYLPSPFVYDKNDTLMDFYNPLYWSYNDQRYAEWGSVYPPLNFIILKFIHMMSGGNYNVDPFSIRYSSLNTSISVIFIFLVAPIIALINIKKKDFNLKKKILIYFIFIFSIPFLFTLERGNLIILTLPLVSLLFIKDNNFLKIISISVLINIKPYFVLLAIMFIIKKRWSDLLITLISSLSIYSISSIFLGTDFFDFMFNILKFESSVFSLREILSMPSSILNIYIFFQNYNPSSSFSNDIMYFLNTIILLAYFAIVICVSYTLAKYRNVLKDDEILMILIVSMTVLLYQIGGYSIIMYLAILPILYKSYKFGLLIVALMFFPLDLIVLYSDVMIQREVYFAYEKIDVNYNLSIGSLLRPALNYFLLSYICWNIFDRMRKK